MTNQLPALIIAIPLISAFLVSGAAWIKRELCYPLTVLATISSMIAAIGLLGTVLKGGIIHYHLGGWLPPFGIEYRIDHLNAFVLVIITTVACLNLPSSRVTATDEFPDKIGAFYALYLLFVSGLCGITITGDAFNLYVLLEITALSGYALLGLGKNHAALSALNYVFLGTIGAGFYLLGIGYLYLATGSLNMEDLARLLPPIYHSKVVLWALVFCLVGLFIKMALFPLHLWLPNAYANAPTATLGLVAPLTTKVMVYVMVRLVFTVFTPQYVFSFPAMTSALVWLAVLAIIAGSLMALAQRHLLRMLSYIIVAEIGYIVGGFWLGNIAGETGAILHIANDATMTLCLVLAAGNIKHAVQDHSFSSMARIIPKMPITMAAFIVGGLSIIGVPPTCGFFSKWYLLKGGITAGQWGFVGALIFSSLISVILFFRIIEIGFFSPNIRSTQMDAPGAKKSLLEPPAGMVLPLIISAVLLIVLGVYTETIVTEVIQFALPRQ